MRGNLLQCVPMVQNISKIHFKLTDLFFFLHDPSVIKIPPKFSLFFFKILIYYWIIKIILINYSAMYKKYLQGFFCPSHSTLRSSPAPTNTRLVVWWTFLAQSKLPVRVLVESKKPSTRTKRHFTATQFVNFLYFYSFFLFTVILGSKLEYIITIILIIST